MAHPGQSSASLAYVVEKGQSGIELDDLRARDRLGAQVHPSGTAQPVLARRRAAAAASAVTSVPLWNVALSRKVNVQDRRSPDTAQDAARPGFANPPLSAPTSASLTCMRVNT